MSESTVASIEELATELDELRQQQAATREILRVIRRSRVTPQPVFETIASAARDLCRAAVANVFTFDGTLVHLAATTQTGQRTNGIGDVRTKFPRPPGRGMAALRAVLLRDVVEIADVTKDADYEEQAHALATGFRAILAVPMELDGLPIGAIVVGRPSPGPFPPRHRSTV
jgi:GAF domain-containing protein